MALAAPNCAGFEQATCAWALHASRVEQTLKAFRKDGGRKTVDRKEAVEELDGIVCKERGGKCCSTTSQSFQTALSPFSRGGWGAARDGIKRNGQAEGAICVISNCVGHKETRGARVLTSKPRCR